MTQFSHAGGLHARERGAPREGVVPFAAMRSADLKKAHEKGARGRGKSNAALDQFARSAITDLSVAG